MSNRERLVEAGRKILRFPLEYRIEHWIFAISFIILGVTGLVQKYFQWPISVATIDLLGGIETTRLIHRISATVMMVAVVYHLGVVGYRLYVKRFRLSMMPGLDDAKNLLGWFLYNLGFRKEQPQEGRYNYGEKIEYWAVVWGTVIMVVTGFMMWNPIATTNLLDGQWIPAAKVAHGGEAVLAVLSIIIWHFYHVLVRTFNRSMFDGHLTEEQMEEEHPLELADMKAGLHQVRLDPDQTSKRRRRFFPIYSIIGGLLLIGIVWFVTFEDTAITTIDPISTVTVFSPLTPTPLPTPAPSPTPRPTSEVEASELDWNTVVGPMLQEQCSACHGDSALGGLNITTYASTLAGGNSGPGVVPGEPSDSFLVIIQEAGGHPGQLNDEDLTTLVNWVSAGAPEGLSGAAPTPPDAPEGEVVTFVDDVQPVFEASCGACHGENALGGLNLLDYESALAGGESGPVIVPEDADGSALVELQEAGGHPGQLTDEEILLVRVWIDAGAPETEADAGGESAAPPSGEEALTYSGGIDVLFESQCGACHGEAAMGGLNLLSYESAMAGGEAGPVIVPGDPGNSLLIVIQEEGGHPGQFDDEALVQVRGWIAAGAPE